MSGRYSPEHKSLFPVSPKFPHTLTHEEYETKWKPHGWRLIVIGPTATWRQDWGDWEAIRDIVQNCLDESESYQYGYDHEGMWIADKGKGVAVSDFLLGPPKLKPDYARGKFGEGMKIAALALLRKGHGVHINTTRRELWIIFLEQKVNGKVQTLAALWKPNGTARGTRFNIVGYQGHSYAENFAVNLPRSDILAEVPSPITAPKQRYNQLIRPRGARSVIYARDIYLREINSPFSYNLWGFALAPDRHGPADETAMYQDMGRLWAGVNKVSLLKQLIPMLTDPPKVAGPEGHNSTETRVLQIDPWIGRDPVSGDQYLTMMYTNRHYWQQAWDATVGKRKVLQTDRTLDSMVTHLGYESQPMQSGVREGLKNAIKTDADVVQEMSERLDEAERIPDHKLPTRHLASLKLARAIAADFRNMGPVHAGMIPPASDMVMRTAGLYEFGTGMIKISADILDSAQKTVAVMVHELAHHVAFKQTLSIEQASDLTPAHALAMEEVAGRVFHALHNGAYDEELELVSW